MADTKISAMTVLTGLAGGDKLAVADASDLTVAKAFTLTELITFLQAANGLPRVVALAATHSISSTTGTEVTGLGPLTLEAGTYVAQYNLLCRANNATTGIRLGVNFGGTATAQAFLLRVAGTGASASTGIIEATTAVDQIMEAYARNAFSTTAPNLGVGLINFEVANQDCLLVLDVSIVVTVAGDLELWHASEVAANTDVRAGSSVVVIRTG